MQANVRRLTLAAAACLVGLLNAATSRATDEPSGSVGSQPQPIRWPASIQGDVRSDSGEPVSGAKVRIDLRWIQLTPMGDLQHYVHSESVVSDSAGHYAFDTSQFPASMRRPIEIYQTAIAPGFAGGQSWSRYDAKTTSIPDERRELKLVPARVVRGRCLSPDGKLVAGAAVDAIYFAPLFPKDPPASNAMDLRQTDANGEFQLSIPLKAAAQVWVSRTDFVAERVEIAADVTQLDIPLRVGTSLFGTLRDVRGDPIPGAVVVLDLDDWGDRAKIDFLFPFFQAVRTNAAGEYRLPPARGLCKIYLSQAAPAAVGVENLGEFVRKTYVVADGPLPAIFPKVLNLADTARGEQRLDLSVGPTLTVSGKITWPDGRPAAGVELRAFYSGIEAKVRFGVAIASCSTDAEGRYELLLPSPLKSMAITGGALSFDEQGKVYMLTPVGQAGMPRPCIDLPDNLQTDIDDLDWVLKSR